MKKVIAVVCLVLLLGAVTSYAAGLKVGDKIGDFKLSAALDDKEYTLSSPNSQAELFISYMPARAQQMIMIMYLKH